MGDDMPDQKNKAHHKSRKRKLKEKAAAEKDGGSEAKSAAKTGDGKARNAKAFTYMSHNRMRKSFVRSQDIKTKKQHIPTVDRTSSQLEPPPFIVGVVGAPKVGKTTLIRGLLKTYTRTKMTHITGPVTIVASKNKRFTFVECNNDICSMIDLAKVADLVLIVIDASFGFEMEVFEFLTICQTHGMPRVIGVLTHLDDKVQTKKIRKNKKFLKHRFWAEVYQGAKLFQLSKIKNGEYMKRELQNLSRFISVIKFRPLSWRNTHPYLLADRMEDITPAEEIRKDPKCDRTVCLYGYARGLPFKSDQDIHVPGCGDFKMSEISFLHDPCPLPEVVKKRALNAKEHLIYAPFSGVGGIVYDKDAVYIELAGSHSYTQQPDDPELAELQKMSKSKSTMEEKLKCAEMTLYDQSRPVASGAYEASENHKSGDESDSGGEESDEEEYDVPEKEPDSSRLRRVVPGMESDEEAPNNEDDEIEEDDDDEDYEDLPDRMSDIDESDEEERPEVSKTGTDLNWKSNLKEKAERKYLSRIDRRDLRSIVYGVREVNESEDESETVGDLFKVRSAAQDQTGINAVDTIVPLAKSVKFKNWLKPENRENIQNCFVTGDFGSEDAAKQLQEDDEFYGDFEDLEEDEDKDEEKNDEKEEADKDSDSERMIKPKPTMHEMRMAHKEKKKKALKKVVDMEGKDQDTFYDDWKTQLNSQMSLNVEEFEGLDDKVRVQYEGFRAGMYVRIEVKGFPCEFVTHFDPSYPIIVGGLSEPESTIGYLNLRVKKHRWYRKILKSKDPVTMSVGWRRFQTIATYCIQDHNMRNRFIKYTPEFMHCNCTVFGPIVPQGTGCLFVQNLARDTPHFRVSAAGSVLDMDKSTSIVKKLKLVGYPHKIDRNTAFIKEMFTSSLEVSKFLGAVIRTVSGIRGQIKKPVSKPPGCFRAKFEDRILKSDIVFLRSWFPMEIPQFYMPVFNLLERPVARDKWQGMKTTGQVRFEKGLTVPNNPDSSYRKIERTPVELKPMNVSTRVKKNLPFSVREKIVLHPEKEKPVAVIREPRDARVQALMDAMRGIHTERVKTREEKENERRLKREKEEKRIEEKRMLKTKSMKKQLYRFMGSGNK